MSWFIVFGLLITVLILVFGMWAVLDPDFVAYNEDEE